MTLGRFIQDHHDEIIRDDFCVFRRYSEGLVTLYYRC